MVKKSTRKTSTDISHSYQSKMRPTLLIRFKSPQSVGFSEPRMSVEFTGHKEENNKEKWIQWGNFGVNIYFTTNRGSSWKDAIKYAKSWITRNVGKEVVESVTVEWESTRR